MNPNKKEQTIIRDWMKAVDFRQNRLWTLTEQGLKTDVNGEMLNDVQFNEMFPIPNPVNFYGGQENPDRTKQFLY